MALSNLRIVLIPGPNIRRAFTSLQDHWSFLWLRMVPRTFLFYWIVGKEKLAEHLKMSVDQAKAIMASFLGKCQLSFPDSS